MQLLPKAENGRFLALLLLLIAFALVYVLGVHWWFSERHLQIADEISDLREQYARFKTKADQKPLIERQLADVRTYEAGNPAFLPEGDFDSAATGMTQRLKQVVAVHAPDTQRCQVIMNQYSRSTEPDPFERVVIKVRLRCDLEPFAGILYDLESASPMLFVEELAIFRQQGYLVPGQNKLSNYLDIRFDLFGFIREPRPGEDSGRQDMTPARRISIVLLASAGIFGGLDLAQRFGIGTSYSLPEGARGRPAAPLALKREVFKLPPWTDYTVVLDRPIFNEDRKPTPITVDPEAGKGEVVVPPLNATLTSIIITRDVKLAIVKDNNTGLSEVVRIGRPLPGEQKGWSLVEVSPRGATFEGEGLGKQSLELAVNEASTGVQVMPPPLANTGKPADPAQQIQQAQQAATAPNAENDAASQARAEEIRRRIEERRRQLREEAERMRSEQTN